MAFADKYVNEILGLEVSLFHAQARMEAGTDTEALHELRICIRRIRSLLIPVRAVPGMAGLREAAAQVGRLTTPTRDLEVMATELEQRGFPEAAAARRSRLAGEYRQVLGSAELKDLFEELDQWPSTFRATNAADQLSRLVTKSIAKHVDRLHRALDDEQFDRHELRVLVKRTRYLTEAFPKLSPLPASAAKSLKAVQSALGAWHDHFQWCLRVAFEPDLKPLQPIWEAASRNELQSAETQLKQLKRLLPAMDHAQ